MHRMIRAAAIRFAANAHSLTEQDLNELRTTYDDDRFVLDICVRFGPQLDVVDIEVIAGNPLRASCSMSLGFDEIAFLSNEELVAMAELEIEKMIRNHSDISLIPQISRDGSLNSLVLSTSAGIDVGNTVEMDMNPDVEKLHSQIADLKTVIADVALENCLLGEGVSGNPDGLAGVVGRP